MSREIHSPMKLAGGERKVPTWLWLAIGMVAFAVWLDVRPPREMKLTYEQRLCAGLNDMQCFERLELERKRREFLESETGQNFIKATSR